MEGTLTQTQNQVKRVCARDVCVCVDGKRWLTVLRSHLGPVEFSPCSADVGTRSAMSASPEHNRESQVRK